MATKRSAKTRKPAAARKGEEPGVQPARKPGRCVVCGDEVAPFSCEELCWVCRRLKISAWREADVQATSPE